ncbi:MAG: sensor histidine kinase [Chloroflexota bacterium]
MLQLLEHARNALPRGGTLSDSSWRLRHNIILTLLWLHAIGAAVFTVIAQPASGHRLTEGVVLTIIALAATCARGHRVRASLTSLGLILSSALLVHLSDGFIESHFHFFIIIAVIALYQDWVPFLIAVGFVVIHHGVFGILEPTAVYNHPDAREHPWKWAAIHGGFVLAACIASIVKWRLSENALARSEKAERDVRALNVELEARVMERTASLARALSELREQAHKREMAEAELAQASARRELDRISRDFVSTASHEFRTPLTAISGFSELLLAQNLATAQQRTWIETMLRESRRLSHLVDDLLDLTRIEEGRVTLHSLPTPLHDVMQGVLLTFADPSTTHRFVVQMNHTVPLVQADPEKLVQILINLISNAVKYSPDGGTVSFSVTMKGSHALVSVTDQGLGMAADEVAMVFGRFNRIDAHADRGIKGSGLGLFITKLLVEMHGGEIWAESPGRGRGSTFSFTIPIATESSVLPTASAARTKGPGATSIGSLVAG